MRSSRSVAWMFGTLLVATLIWTAAAGAGDPPSLQRAKELFKARQYAEALKACNQAIAEDPASAESYRQRALCRQRLDDLRGALADLDRAVEIEPRNATNWSSRSSLKRQLKDTTGAWSDIERAAALAPDDAHILNNRGLLRSDRGDYRGAVDDYTRALQADPRMSQALNNRGLAKEKLKDMAGALADYTQAVEVNPRNADAFSNRAYCRNRMGDAAGARQDYAQALAIEPGHDFATKQLAKLEGGGAGSSRTETGGSATGTTTAWGIPPSGTPVRLPSLTFEASDPCATAAKPRDGMPWQTPGRLPPVTQTPGVLPAAAVLPPFADFNRISPTQYNGEVSMAMEGMRLLYGPMSLEDEQRFQTAWAPLFDHPTPEAAEYLRRLIPLLGQFLAGREAFIRTAVAVEASLRDAAVGVAADTRGCYLDAVAAAARQQEFLRSLQAGLEQTASQIKALGNPPNPLAAKCAARERYRRSFPQTPSGLDGEWVSDSGVRLYFKTVKRYPGGLALVYQYSFAFADTLAAAGVTAAKPGWVTTRDGKQILVPGLEDALRLVEEQPDGVLLSSPQELGATLDGFFPDGERLHYVRYATGLTDRWAFSGTTYYRAPAAHGEPPMLPGHTWAALLDVATRFESQRIQQLQRAKQEYATQIRELLACDPENLPVPPPVRNPWDEGPYKADDPRSKQPTDQTAETADTKKSKTATRSTTSSPETVDAAAVEETVAFHEALIELLNRNLRKEQEELEREPDPARRKTLAFRMIQLQSDIQAEQDLIASYRTGKLVHTRSAFDEYASDKFIHQVREEAARADATRRIAALVEQQVGQLPEEQRQATRERVWKLLDAKTVAGGDVEKVLQVAGALDTMLQGYAMGKEAAQEEKAIAKAERDFYINMAVMAVGAVTIGVGCEALAQAYGAEAAITQWGPHILGSIYGGTTGLVMGGPTEGAYQAIAWSSPVGLLATQFFDGYTREPADAKSTSWEDRVWAGARQAGAAYLMGKAAQIGTGLFVKGALSYYGPDSTLFKPVLGPGRNVKLAFDAARMQQDVDDAKALIGFFQEKQAAMARLRAQLPAGSPQLAQAEQELGRLAASINSSYHCKLLMKYHAHPAVRSLFTRLVDQSYAEAMPEMLRLLKAQGYDVSNLRFKPMRNASSAGTSSMDLDLALMETPNLVITKNGKPVSIAQFQQDGQRALNEAYHSVTGFSATRSEVNLTTSAHAESFASKRLLKAKVNFDQLTAEEVESIGKVLGVKHDKIEGDPVLGEIAKLQAQSRESAKEIDNMLLPQLQQKLSKAPAGSREAQQAQADLHYWQDMSRNFKQAAARETNPYAILQLDRTVRQQTGGKGFQEVSRDLVRQFRK